MEEEKYPFIDELRGKPEVKKVVDSMGKAREDLQTLMMDVRETSPELYNKLVDVHKTIAGFKIYMTHQFNGVIWKAD